MEIYVPDKSQPPMKRSLDIESQLSTDENPTISQVITIDSLIKQPAFKTVALPIYSVNPNENSGIVEKQ